MKMVQEKTTKYNTLGWQAVRVLLKPNYGVEQ